MEFSPDHCGPEQQKIQTEVQGHSLVCSLVHSHRSLVRSLARFTHSLARGTVNDCMAIYSVFFFSILAHSAILFLQFFISSSLGVYYKTCGSEELAAFLASPEEYLPPISVRRLPEDPDYLPRKRDRAWAKHQFPQQVHYCPEQQQKKNRYKYWVTRSSVCSHRSLIRLLRTTRFTRALRCAHFFTRSLETKSIESSLGFA